MHFSKKTKILALVCLVALACFYVKIFNMSCRQECEIELKQDCAPEVVTEGETFSREKRRPQNLLNIYDDVRNYILFIGHSRTGHTLVASLLDAHPEVIISDELGCKWSNWVEDTSQIPNFALTKYKFLNNIHMHSQNLATFGFRSPPDLFSKGKEPAGNHSYNYHVSGQWQGQFRDKITVIGDKSGHFTSVYFHDPTRLVKLDYIQKNLGVSLKILHVIRNPYDVLATRVLRRGNARDTADLSKKVNLTKDLDGFMDTYLRNTRSIEQIRQKYDVLDVHGHELIQQPRQTLQKMCDYIGVTCEEDYFDACSKLLHKKAAVTRNSVVWTDEQLRRLQEEFEKYSFLRRYSMHSDQ